MEGSHDDTIPLEFGEEAGEVSKSRGRPGNVNQDGRQRKLTEEVLYV